VTVDMTLTTPNCPSAAGTPDHGGKCRVERRGRRAGDGEHRLGSAVDQSRMSDEARTTAEHVVMPVWAGFTFRKFVVILRL